MFVISLFIYFVITVAAFIIRCLINGDNTYIEICRNGKVQCTLSEPEFIPDLQELYRIKNAGYIFKINGKKATLSEVQAFKNEKKAARK